MSTFIIEISGPEAGPDTVRLAAGRHSLGRSSSCDVVIGDPKVSRSHAEIIISATEAYLRSTGGRNGLVYNGRAVSAQGPLAEGDIIGLGDSSLRVIGFDTDGAKAGALQPQARLGADAVAFDPTETLIITDDFQAYRVGSAELPPDTMNTDEIREFKALVDDEVLKRLDLYKRDKIRDMSPEDLRRDTTQTAHEVIRDLKLKLPRGADAEMLVREIVAEAIGLGPIEPLLADESVTEIMVNGSSQIYVERAGRLHLVPVRYSGDKALMSTIERIVTPIGRRIDEGSPMVDARLPDGSRVNAIIPPLALKGPTLTIRKFAKQKLTIQDLIAKDSISADMAAFLENCVKYRRNVLVSGGTGTGKTTMLNILSNFIPESERIVTIEDAAELQLVQPHVVTLEARPPNVEGKGAVSIRELVKNSLRMRPDRVVIGECRGGEALDMLQAMNTGHDGSLTTGHANSPRDFLSRLEVMVLMSGIDLPVRAIREQIASAVDIIVQITRFSDGSRRVTAINEVDGIEKDVILMQKLFEFKQSGISPDGNVLGEFRGCGQAPSFYNELRDNGLDLDRSIFGEPVQAATDWGEGA